MAAIKDFVRGKQLRRRPYAAPRLVLDDDLRKAFERGSITRDEAELTQLNREPGFFDRRRFF